MRATDPQKSYLSRLANECFVLGLEVGYDMRAALRTMRKDEASTEIQRLLRLKEAAKEDGSRVEEADQR